MTLTLAHAGLSLYIGLLPKTWILYVIDEILRVVGIVYFSVSVAY